MRAQRRSLDQQGEEQLVLDERAVYHLQRVIAQRLLVLAPATVIHGCSLAQLVVVLAFQIDEIYRAAGEYRGWPSAVLALLEVAVVAVLAVGLAGVAEFADDPVVELLA